MSFWKRNERIIHFAHIPKNASKSFTNLLVENDWIELKEYRYNNSKHTSFYDSRISYKKLSPDVSFAILRNPYDRVISHLNQVKRYIKKDFDFNIVIKNMFEKVLPQQGYNTDDNHWLQQYCFLGSDTIKFKIESESKSAIKMLKDEKILRETSFLKKIHSHYEKTSRSILNKESLKLINEFYHADFTMFDYKMEN